MAYEGDDLFAFSHSFFLTQNHVFFGIDSCTRSSMLKAGLAYQQGIVRAFIAYLSRQIHRLGVP